MTFYQKFSAAKISTHTRHKSVYQPKKISSITHQIYCLNEISKTSALGFCTLFFSCAIKQFLHRIFFFTVFRALFALVVVVYVCCLFIIKRVLSFPIFIFLRLIIARYSLILVVFGFVSFVRRENCVHRYLLLDILYGVLYIHSLTMEFDFGMRFSFFPVFPKMMARKEPFHHKDRSFVRYVYGHTVCFAKCNIYEIRKRYLFYVMLIYVCLRCVLQRASIVWVGV